MLEGCACLHADILIDAAALDDIHDLHAAADAEHGQILFQRSLADAHFTGITEGVNFAALAKGLLSEQERIDITAAGQQKSVQKEGQCLMGQEHDGTAACLFDGKDIILTEGIFLFFVRIIRRNADNRFCVHLLHLLLSFSLLSIQKMLFFCNGRMGKSASTCRVYTVCGIIRMRDKNQTAEVCGQIFARQQKRR